MDILIVKNPIGLNKIVREYGYKLTLNKTDYMGIVHTNSEDRYDELVKNFGEDYIYRIEEV